MQCDATTSTWLIAGFFDGPKSHPDASLFNLTRSKVTRKVPLADGNLVLIGYDGSPYALGLLVGVGVTDEVKQRLKESSTTLLARRIQVDGAVWLIVTQRGCASSTIRHKFLVECIKARPDLQSSDYFRKYDVVAPHVTKYVLVYLSARRSIKCCVSRHPTLALTLASDVNGCTVAVAWTDPAGQSHFRATDDTIAFPVCDALVQWGGEPVRPDQHLFAHKVNLPVAERKKEYYPADALLVSPSGALRCACEIDRLLSSLDFGTAKYGRHARAIAGHQAARERAREVTVARLSRATAAAAVRGVLGAICAEREARETAEREQREQQLCAARELVASAFGQALSEAARADAGAAAQQASRLAALRQVNADKAASVAESLRARAERAAQADAEAAAAAKAAERAARKEAAEEAARTARIAAKQQATRAKRQTKPEAVAKPEPKPKPRPRRCFDGTACRFLGLSCDYFHTPAELAEAGNILCPFHPHCRQRMICKFRHGPVPLGVTPPAPPPPPPPPPPQPLFRPSPTWPAAKARGPAVRMWPEPPVEVPPPAAAPEQPSPSGGVSLECAFCFESVTDKHALACGHVSCQMCAARQVAAGRCFVCETACDRSLKLFF